MDPQCFIGEDDAEAAACNDLWDNDGDGWIDLDDPGCGGDPDDDDEGGLSSFQCNDGTDNDLDGLEDADDPGCATGYGQDEDNPLPCDDGVDNDGDGWVDWYEDPGCDSDPDSPDEEGVPAIFECSDGTDNDGDGLIDALDPHCYSGFDEAEAAECNDGIDNDGDGWVDAGADAGCSDPDDNNEDGFDLVGECSDNTDNDGDGDIDALDDECDSPWSDEGEDCDEDDLEPNDDLGEATFVDEQSTTELADMRLCEGGEDWFAIEVTSLGGVEVWVTHDYAEGDLSLEIWDIFGGVIAESDTPSNTEYATAQNPTPIPGPVYVRVYLVNDSGTEPGNDYEITIVGT